MINMSEKKKITSSKVCSFSFFNSSGDFLFFSEDPTTTVSIQYIMSLMIYAITNFKCLPSLLLWRLKDCEPSIIRVGCLLRDISWNSLSRLAGGGVATNRGKKFWTDNILLFALDKSPEEDNVDVLSNILIVRSSSSRGIESGFFIRTMK